MQLNQFDRTGFAHSGVTVTCQDNEKGMVLIG